MDLVAGHAFNNQFPLPNPKLLVQSATCLLGHKHDENTGRGGTVKNVMGKMEGKDNMRTRGPDGWSLLNLPPRVYIHDCSLGLSGHDCTIQALFRAHMGNLGNQHMLGPI